MQIALIVLGYLVGSIPFAVLVVRLLHGKDVRHTGSGNIGARNSLRVGGKKAGILVLILDALKSALPMLLAKLLTNNLWTVALVGAAAITGHCFSWYLIWRSLRMTWHGWRVALVRWGGQGLASALGVIAVLAPLLILPVLGLGIAINFGLKRSTLAATTMIVVAPILAAWRGYEPAVWTGFAISAVVIGIKLLQDIPPGVSEPM